MVDGGEPGVNSRDEGKHTGRNDLLFVKKMMWMDERVRRQTNKQNLSGQYKKNTKCPKYPYSHCLLSPARSSTRSQTLPFQAAREFANTVAQFTHAVNKA